MNIDSTMKELAEYIRLGEEVAAIAEICKTVKITIILINMRHLKNY